MKVSIGIPFYNAGLFLKHAINSVLQQDFIDFELILLNDGSSDDSLKIAKSFNDKRIRVISDGKNRGLPARLNELIELSQGEYIARMDADDVISTKKIAQQVNFLDASPNINIVSTGMCSITNNNQVIGYRVANNLDNASPSIATAVFGKMDIAHATIMARKSWYQRNYYNTNAKLMEDYQLWVDAVIKQDLAVGYIRTPLYFYREESSISPNKAIKAYINQFRIVLSLYFTHLTMSEKIKFSLLTGIKVATVFLLNLVNNSNYLLQLRNKNTLQDPVVLSKLQKELDTIGLD